jgi:hypothetical protein
MATPVCWSFELPGCFVCRFRREQCTPASVDPANNFAVKNMSPDDSKRAYRKDLLLASAIVAVGLAVSGLSLAELKASNPQMAQATQPLQSTPGAETKPSAPPDPATIGARPTEIPPQPARPDAEAQKAGATPALPPAPAEKIGTPIKER